MRAVRWIALALATACAPLDAPDVSMQSRAFGAIAPSLPARATAPPLRSNAEMAGDFIELEFQLESGSPLATLTRFEGPITVGFAGPVPASAPEDLAHLLSRLRTEAGLAITLAEPGAQPALVVEFVPRARLKRAAPSAACFVVPGVQSFAQYRVARDSPDLRWDRVTLRRQAAVFIPSDTSPQEVRDCLHEEIAQALGPLNDLYRLPDSVFNDDNFNSTLTGFDMLMLRLRYAPELRNGMTRVEAQALVPRVLSRLNPYGDTVSGAASRPTPGAWIAAVDTAFNANAPDTARRKAADRMLTTARTEGWSDVRLGLSYYAQGRVNVSQNPELAIRAFADSSSVYQKQPGGAIHAAHADAQLAALALAQGADEQAVALTDGALPVVWRSDNAALLATLMLIKAEALGNLGRDDAARALRLDSMDWARYGFGGPEQVRARMAEIAALGARGRRR